MKRLCLILRHRRLIAGAVFLALLFQSMIPAGFMPASDGSFALQICHSGLLTQSGDHGDQGDQQGAAHSGGHSHVEFCPFGALPGAGPIAHIATFLPSLSVTPQPIADPGFRPPAARFDRAHTPRGPPDRSILV
jgi:hypothetical protein